MNTITLKRNLSFREYQLLVQTLEDMGIEVENQIDAFTLDEEDLKKIAISNEEAKKGMLIPSKEIREKALGLCMK